MRKMYQIQQQIKELLHLAKKYKCVEALFVTGEQPADSELKHLNYDKKYLYNFIRMLSDPYPNAFLRVGNQKIIFKWANGG